MADSAHTVVLVRHGELGLKSPRVRARLERTLTQRIEEALARESVEGIVRRVHSRHVAEASDLPTVMRSLARVFGVTTFSPATRTGAEMETIMAAAAAYARHHWPAGASSFAIRARRIGSHPYTSRDVGVKAGSAVFLALQADGVPVRVDLDDPDFELHIEVRNKEAYLHHERFSGPGGLPLGTQGRVAVWISGTDAAAAAYLMMRRGAQILPYALVPASPPAAPHPAEAVVAHLAQWGGPKRLQRIDSPVPVPARGDPLDALVRFARAAVAAGIEVAQARGANAVVTAETARAPWAHRLADTHPGGDIPVLRPLMGLDRALVDDFREVLGLRRRGAARADATQRAYTAGGRGLKGTYAEPAAAGDAEETWDPY